MTFICRQNVDFNYYTETKPAVLKMIKTSGAYCLDSFICNNIFIAGFLTNYSPYNFSFLVAIILFYLPICDTKSLYEILPENRAWLNPCSSPRHSGISMSGGTSAVISAHSLTVRLDNTLRAISAVQAEVKITVH